jgi:hypothetical protein
MKNIGYIVALMKSGFETAQISDKYFRLEIHNDTSKLLIHIIQRYMVQLAICESQWYDTICEYLIDRTGYP